MEANGSARSASGWSIIMGDLVSCFIARQCWNRNTVFLVMLGPVLGECGSDGSFFGGVIVAASVLSKTNINIIYPILSILFNSVKLYQLYQLYQLYPITIYHFHFHMIQI